MINEKIFLWNVSGMTRKRIFRDFQRPTRSRRLTFSNACLSSSGRGFFFSFHTNSRASIFRPFFIRNTHEIPSIIQHIHHISKHAKTLRVQITRMMMMMIHSFDTLSDISYLIASAWWFTLKLSLFPFALVSFPPSLINYEESSILSGWHKRIKNQTQTWSQMQSNLAKCKCSEKCDFRLRDNLHLSKRKKRKKT